MGENKLVGESSFPKLTDSSDYNSSHFTNENSYRRQNSLNKYGSKNVELNENTAEKDIGVSENKKIIYKDENIAVTFLKVWDEPMIYGCTYIQFEIENLSGKSVVPLFNAFTVNGHTAELLGSPCDIKLKSESSVRITLFFSRRQAEINGADEIRGIELKLQICDEHSAQIYMTEAVCFSV